MIKFHKALPNIARNILITYKSYLVGSAVKYMLQDDEVLPKDFDIIVDPEEYMLACRFAKDSYHVLNNFGGLKLTDNIIGHQSSEVVYVDIWPSTLDTYIRKCVDTRVVSFNPNRLIEWR